jgi:ABC-type lipoprotein export system ATPase subunit
MSALSAKEEKAMDADLTRVNEIEDDEELVASWETSQPASQDGKRVTIAAEGLSKHFQHKQGLVRAVDGVSFTFTEQQFITIIGPSGSGKSTLLYLLGGLDRATGGRLLIDGVDVTRLSERQEHEFRRKKLGFIFQSFHLIPHLTVLENVLLPMQLTGGQSQAQMRERARRLLLELGISEDRHRFVPGRLSGGQKQRVAIARALANDPQVILADEPTGNLDVYHGRLIIQLLKRLAEQGKTVIVVTHDRSVTWLADVRLEMEDGKLRPMPQYVGRSPATSASARPVIPAEERAVTVSAEELSRYFKYQGGLVKAVDGASFTFTEQQFVTITGPSGSGKTTLLYLLGGLDKATKGTLLVDGVNMRRLSGRKENRLRRRKLGFVFQSFHLVPNLTALENVMLPMQLAGGRSRTQMRTRAHDLLLEVGISEDRHYHKPGELSGGQQQRVALARALANDPRIILADEPTGNLDSYSSKLVIRLLKSFAEQGKTVIVVTHDGSIAKLADLRIRLVDGRVKGSGNATTPTGRTIPAYTQKRNRKKK